MMLHHFAGKSYNPKLAKGSGALGISERKLGPAGLALFELVPCCRTVVLQLPPKKYNPAAYPSCYGPVIMGLNCITLPHCEHPAVSWCRITSERSFVLLPYGLRGLKLAGLWDTNLLVGHQVQAFFLEFSLSFDQCHLLMGTCTSVGGMIESKS